MSTQSFHFSHIADFYQELWRRNEFSNSACFLAQDYDCLSSIDQTLKEIEHLATPLDHPTEEHPQYATCT